MIGTTYFNELKQQFGSASIAPSPVALFDLIFNNVAELPDEASEIDVPQPTPWIHLQWLEEELRRRGHLGLRS